MMETTALYIGYAILVVVALAIIVFGSALCWFAIHEARAIIYSRKWRKRKLKQLSYETARDCAYYLNRWVLPYNVRNIHEICNYFDDKIYRQQKKGEK